MLTRNFKHVQLYGPLEALCFLLQGTEQMAFSLKTIKPKDLNRRKTKRIRGGESGVNHLNAHLSLPEAPQFKGITQYYFF